MSSSIAQDGHDSVRDEAERALRELEARVGIDRASDDETWLHLARERAMATPSAAGVDLGEECAAPTALPPPVMSPGSEDTSSGSDDEDRAPPRMRPQRVRRDSIAEPPLVSAIRAGAQIGYTSFVMHHRSAALAQYFGAIDRDLLLGVGCTELGAWAARAEEDVDVTDWAQFLNARAHAKAEALARGTSADADGARVVLARAALVRKFVVSELALTAPGGRSALAGKFIRIAWKSYIAGNFAGIPALVEGLETPSARAAMGVEWTEVDKWEMRLVEALHAFALPDGDFRVIRDATQERVSNSAACIALVCAYAEPSYADEFAAAQRCARQTQYAAPDRRIALRCLKLKCLDAPSLARALAAP